MQKKIIALAVAGLVSGVAFAQTNVTIYGVADVGYTYSQSDRGDGLSGKYKFSGLRDGTDNGQNGSRIGFKGEEALGNGLKVIFVTELRVNQTEGTQAGVARQTFVGLSSSKFGTFTAGRQYSAAGDVVGKNSSNDAVTVMPYNVFQGTAGQQIVSAGGNSRQSNAIKYVSPTFSGFTGRASYAFSNNTRTANNATYNDEAETTDNGRFAISGDYTNGPISVDLIYALTSNAYTPYGGIPASYAAGQGKNINEWYVGGSYDFKVVKAYGSYQTLKNDNNLAATITDSKLWQIGLSAPVGANGKFMIEYAKVDFDQDNNTNAATRQDGGNSGWGIGYLHNLSKRTALYAYASQLDYDSNTALTSTGTPDVGGATVGVATAGEKQTSFSFGVRHAF